MDKAKRYLDRVIEAHKGNQDTLKILKNHEQQLIETRKLLIKVEYQSDLQVPSVALALPKVTKAANTLLMSLGHGQPEGLDQVASAVVELQEATVNLKKSLPTSYFVSNRNEVKDGIAITGLVGYVELGGRVTTESNDNKTERALLLSGPIIGDPQIAVELAKLQQAMNNNNKRGA